MVMATDSKGLPTPTYCEESYNFSEALQKMAKISLKELTL